MKIIDFEKKGNVVRFYFGEDSLNEWWGDDWDDVPYEHNAGTVYLKYVCACCDVAFPYDWLVIEPRDGSYYNSPFSKEDMIKRRCPCIIAVSPDLFEGLFPDETYASWVGCNKDGVYKIYFGDTSLPGNFKIIETKNIEEGTKENT